MCDHQMIELIFFCLHNRWNGPWLEGGWNDYVTEKLTDARYSFGAPEDSGSIICQPVKKPNFFWPAKAEIFCLGAPKRCHTTLLWMRCVNLISFSCKNSSMLLVVDTRVHSTHVEKCLFCHFGVCKLHQNAPKLYTKFSFLVDFFHHFRAFNERTLRCPFNVIG